MPELPEVETMRRGLLPIIGRVVSMVEYPRIPYRPISVQPSPDELARRCKGKRIVAVQRIAKRVLIQLDSEDCIVLQPKMAGLLLLSDPPSTQHTRVIFHLEGHEIPRQFLYWDRRGLGTVSLWNPSEIQQKLGPGVLGPDALSVEEATFIDRVRACQREIKVALLDQRIVAGIGNIYAAEILFAAKVHPQARCHEISTKSCKKIYTQMIDILQTAIEHEGSTLSDGTYRNAINGEGNYQSQHLVYDREGQQCFRCRKQAIQRIVQAQRSTFFCPACQKSAN